MKAIVQYNDLVGTAAADITDAGASHSLEDLGEIAGIDTDRYRVVGVSIYGRSCSIISLICVDREQSTEEKEHIVKISISESSASKDHIFKRLHVVLYARHDTKYPELDYDEEIIFSRNIEENE